MIAKEFLSIAQVSPLIDDVGNPPLKWAGGKRWLVPRLRLAYASHRKSRLVEPFVGGLAVALGLQPREALLNDTNQHLINFYSQVKRGLDLRSFHHRFQNDREVFAENRKRFNELVALEDSETAEAAALFYYLNRTAFNGLCRFNASGFFNVPFGKYKTIRYRNGFEDLHSIFDSFMFRAGDFETLHTHRSDFVYADPPYDVEFTSYSPGGFTWDDQVRLAKWLARHKGPVVASNQATERILRLYDELGFDLMKLEAPRRISCNGNRDNAVEMLAFKNL